MMRHFLSLVVLLLIVGTVGPSESMLGASGQGTGKAAQIAPVGTWKLISASGSTVTSGTIPARFPTA
jgi:hypothetical protein